MKIFIFIEISLYPGANNDLDIHIVASSDHDRTHL